MNDPLSDLDPLSSLTSSCPPPSSLDDTPFDPLQRARSRRHELPPSRYQFRPPRYYRGPLHPHQPPASSSPASREFIPGPFSLPRLSQTYATSIAADLLTLTYVHHPPGVPTPPRASRLRPWDNSSPYHMNRPLRGPRGSNALRLLRKPATFRNIPVLQSIVVHTMVSEALKSSAPLHVAGMVIQAITGMQATVCKSTHDNSSFNLRKGRYIAVKAELRGEDMWHFAGRLVDVVLPRVKDYRGVKGSSGDNSGNITFGLTGDGVGGFPEIEVNYDMYPPHMIPGCHITMKTSATNDRDARLLLSAMGLPFYGKLVD